MTDLLQKAKTYLSNNHNESRTYFILGIINAIFLCGLIFLLSLNHRQFEQVSQLNKKHDDVVIALNHIAAVISDMSAPGNDVFDDHAPKKQYGLLLNATQQFDQYSKLLKDSFVAFNFLFKENYAVVDAGQFAQQTQNISLINLRKQKMVEITRRILQKAQSQQYDLAATQMSKLDATFRNTLQLINHTHALLNETYTLATSESQRKQKILTYYQYAAVLLTVFLITFNIYYGYRLLKKMQNIASYQQKLLHRNTVYAHELELREVNLRTILETVADAIITISKEGEVISFNIAAEDIFGYQASDVIGKSISMLMPEPHATLHSSYLKRYLSTGVAHIIGFRRELTGLRKDGSVFPIELAVSKMVINDEIKFTGVVRDITERKEIEKMQREFISTVSHELRTPLTSIKGSLSLLCSGMFGLFEQKVTTLQQVALNNCERLIRLINDILDIEKMREGKLKYNFSKVALQNIVDTALSDNASYAKQFNVEIQRLGDSDDIWVYIDADRILQVFANLLSNACKFSPRGSTVDLITQVQGVSVLIQVIDHGAGISEEFKKRIFQPFSQADSSDVRKQQGTGLGLAISREIVGSHGGHLSFRTETDVGTIFYFDLAIHQILLDDIGDCAISSTPRALICDDDPDFINLIKEIAESVGLTLDVAVNAQVCKNYLNQYNYHMMICDLLLPGEDGLTLLSEMRATTRLKLLPVLILSAVADVHIKLKEQDKYIMDCLKKPVDVSLLRTILSRIVL